MFQTDRQDQEEDITCHNTSAKKLEVNNEKWCNRTSDNSLEYIKYMLGGDGLEILSAVGKGADSPDIICLLSGVPIKCVEGRMHIIIDLGLVKEKNHKYKLRKKGITFLSQQGLQAISL